MRAPAQAKPLSAVSEKLYLRIYMARWYAGVFRPVPDHDPPVGAHSSNNIWILWLISSLVHLPLMVDLLHNIKLDLHDKCLLRRSTSVTANLFALFVIVGGIGSYRFWKLHMSNLKVVLGFAGGMSANEKSMGFVIFVWYTTPVNAPSEGGTGCGRSGFKPEKLTIAYLAAIELKAWATPEQY